MGLFVTWVPDLQLWPGCSISGRRSPPKWRKPLIPPSCPTPDLHARRRGRRPQPASWSRLATPAPSPPRGTSPRMPASLRSPADPAVRSRANTQLGAGTNASRTPCYSQRSPPCTTPAPTTTGNEPKAGNTTPHSSASRDAAPTPSTPSTRRHLLPRKNLISGLTKR